LSLTVLALIIEQNFYLSRGGEEEFRLNIMFDSYDMITTRQEVSLGISEMGKDIGLEWRKANPGNGVTARISGDSVTP
jgi:hypothetical protein